jgi:hypothetical protein
MAQVFLVEGRGDLLCENCGLTQPHKVELYYDHTTKELVVTTTCKCEVVDDGDIYEEERAVEVTA